MKMLVKHSIPRATGGLFGILWLVVLQSCDGGYNGSSSTLTRQ